MEEERFFSNRELYDLIQDTAREMQSLKKEMAETRTLIRDYNQLRQKVEQVDSRISTLMWLTPIAIAATGVLFTALNFFLK
jgi:predicted RNase H-like nuclease (RuvC/YqgF family)